MLVEGGTLDGRHYLSAATLDTMLAPHVPIAGLGAQATPFALGFAIGVSASDASHQQPVGTGSWAGSGNTYFFVDPSRHAVALFMTHELTPGATAARTATFRATMNRAAERILAR
jgi:CubicO group peptidase (beta-lactamase class C family)